MALNKTSKTVAAVVALTLAGVAVYLLNRPESAASSQSTDDAYIKADITAVAPQVAGLVIGVLVDENQTVKAGQPLVRIDDRDYVLAVSSARAALASAQATAQAAQAQTVVQESVIRQAQSALQADSANVQLARAEASRYVKLAADGSGTVQARQQAQARLKVQEAAQSKDAALLQAETERITIQRADLARSQAAVEHAQAVLDRAQLDLQRTQIVAPVDGTVGQKRVRAGNFVKVGEELVTVVPLKDIYIVANFRETQLAHMRAGQAVTLTVDALPGMEFKGHVQSLGPASGVSYSAIAPHNATGNFTKIVQRLPVRIALEPDQDQGELLRVGMSVQPTVAVASGS